MYTQPWFRLVLQADLLLAFVLALISIILRTNRILGLTAMGATLLASIVGASSHGQAGGEPASGTLLGLDWFVLNVIFTGLIFIPLERLFPRHKEQPVFRTEWREDLFYYLVSSMMVQILTFLSLSPSMEILAHTQSMSFRGWVAGQPLILQIVEIMFLTDFLQYWVHRAFHKIPWLWNFHAVHHSATTMDWMAGARMHFMEIIVLRAVTVIPMYTLGFRDTALYMYVLLVYVHSTFIHSNVGWNFNWIGKFLVTPRFHHWHHGEEREAIDVNFSIHFPLLDRLFGTFHLPKDQWPKGYGIGGQPVPKGYWRQFWYPLLPKAKSKDS